MPNAFSDVNFIPDDVVSNRKHESQIKSLNKFAIVAMVLSLLIGVGLFGYNFYTKNKISSLQNEVATEKSKIEELSEFAEKGYKLGLRLDSIKKILDERPYYGKVIDQLYREIPNGITITSFSIGEAGQVTLSGGSFPNYTPIAVLQDNLERSDSEYFTDIRLTSASLDKSSSGVTFTITFLINLAETNEPIR